MPRTYKLEDTGYDGVIHSDDNLDSKMAKVIEKSNEWGDEIPIGIFYQNEYIPTYEDRIASRIDNYLTNPLQNRIYQTVKKSQFPQYRKY